MTLEEYRRVIKRAQDGFNQLSASDQLKFKQETSKGFLDMSLSGKVVARSIVDTSDAWDPVEDIRKFHEKFRLEYQGPVRGLDEDMQWFRQKFMMEELTEYKDNMVGLTYELGSKVLNKEKVDNHLEEMFDALIDLVYVALGTSYLHGFNFKEGWNRVQKANMAKVRVANLKDSKRNSRYDVVKPEGWQKPDHRDLVKDNIYVKDSR